MTGNGIIRTIALWTVLVLMTSCSIYDGYPHRRQYDVVLQLSDSAGNVIPDSIASVSEIYAFVNGVYQGRYAKESDGKIRVTFNDNDSVTFVAIAGRRLGEYTLNTPQTGEAIENTWLQLKTAGAGVTHQPSAIYYGNISTVGDISDVADVKRTITLRDIRAKVRVHVRGLLDRFGPGNYRIVIEGLRSGVAYDGTTGGDYVNYEMGGAFNDKGDWITDPAIVLPSKGETVKLRIYKQDGTLLFDRDHDEDGNPLVIKSNEDAVFIVTASSLLNMTLRVVPFEDVINSGFFQ